MTGSEQAPVIAWVLSAETKGELLGRARDLKEYLDEHDSVDVADVAYTLASDEAVLGHRAVLTGRDADDFRRALEALELGTPSAHLIEGAAERAEDAVFVFPPQGPEWEGMACELLDASETFRHHIDACERALDPFVDWSLTDVLRGAEGAPGLDRGDVVQPALFAIAVALAELLRVHGLEPVAVLGHSLGEIPASYLAGGLSLEDAARVVALWSQGQETQRDRGGMASVQLSPTELEPYLEQWEGRLNVAAHNGPSVTIVSGDSEPLDELIDAIKADGKRGQRISVPFAAHSPHIDAIRERLLSDLEPIEPHSAKMPFFSSARGDALDTAELDYEYWPRALRELVQFEEATRAVLAAGHRLLIEVTPHPVLTLGLRQTVDAAGEGAVLTTLRRDQAGPERVLASVAEAWVHGAEVDWKAALEEGERETLDIPRTHSSVDPDERKSLNERIRSARSEEREALVLDLVRSQVAAALGLDGPDAVGADRAFKELGFDSATAVQLAEELGRLLDVALPATAAFDNPTPAALAERALAEVTGEAPQVTFEELPAAALDEPIAIVGIGCRFPGEIASGEDLWRFVDSGGDAIGRFPEDRGWDLERLYDTDPDQVRTCYVRDGGFLYDAAEFDPDFFGIAPREALAMDPQQRLLLQVAWEALEDAGIDPLSLRGSSTGVFAGAFPQEYGPPLHEADATAGYSLTGSLTSVVSGRVAYSLGFVGPAVTIDTACSSSLVALHQACTALRQGECTLALAGGVTVLATPGLLVEFSRQRGLAMDGRCKSFAAAADGTGFAEGAGLLVVERLSDARERGHHVLAIVRGSAINQDGASNGLSAPNGPSQERVIRQALANARLSAADVDAVEAHGTGTTLGDPIEAGALLATYGRERADGQPLWLGSIKSNIGHTNAAAGAAGVIKMVEALRHGRLPATLHVDEPNPHVNWSAGEVELLREPVDWPAGERVRRAGVSSFGISGTNAHVILEEAPAEDAPDAAGEAQAPSEAGALPFVVSGATEQALAAQAGRLASFLERREPELYAVACALARRRAHLAQRAAVVAEDPAQLVERLRALERGEFVDGVVRGTSEGAGAIAFLFSGQGSQWPGMGAELYEQFPVFAEALDEACAELDRHTDRPLKDVMFAAKDSEEGELLADTSFTQVALFALEVALYRLLESFGIRPDFLIGHSVGEFAAAYVAGVFSLEDGCRLVAERARLMGALPEGGGMLAIEAAEDEVVESLADYEDRLAVAAVNGPRAVVVSGDDDAIDEVEAIWRERDRRTTKLRVSHAFHSHRMEPALDELKAVAEEIELSEPQIPIVSNVTGEQLTADDARSADYWVRHVRNTVRFADGVRFLQEAGVTRYLELGPDATLATMAAQSAGAEASGPLFASTLRKKVGQREALMAFLGGAHCNGIEVDWGELLDDRGVGRVDLPTYAFQRERFWLVESPGGAGDVTAAGQLSAGHPLLGAALELAGDDAWVFTGLVSQATHPWLADHAVAHVVLLPGTAFVELALLAARRVGAGPVEDLTLMAPLVLEGDRALQVQVRVAEPSEDGRRAVEVYSSPQRAEEDQADEDPWTLHASGMLGAADGPAADAELDEALDAFAAESWPPEGADELDAESFYERLAAAGYDYGPVFQGLRGAYRSGDAWYGEVALEGDGGGDAGEFGVHPALVDAALHTMLLAMLERRPEDAPPEVPFSFSAVSLRRTGASELRVRIDVADGESDDDATSVRLLALDESGEPVLAIGALKLRAVDREELRAQAATAGHDALFGIDWVELDGAADGSALQAARLGSDDAPELDSAGIELSRYPDLEAIEEMVEAGAPAPDVVVVRSGGDGGALPGAVHEEAARTLELLKAWLASERLVDARLVLLTSGAMAVADDESPDLAQVALVGLMRSAQSENPDRFGVIDLDASEESADGLAAALASGEPELALRGGRALAPRLARAAVADDDAAEALDPDGTILITGGTGALGGLVARHLAEHHDARRLLLASRSGGDADGADELVAALEELGCEARVVACDAADREQLEKALGEIPDDHPLTAVVHAAGVLDDGVIGSLDGERLRTVMAPKVDAALNLHELTKDMELAQFVLFSSVASALGTPGQANYAAANAFLDGLAQHRRAAGLPATSLAWGPWEQAGGMLGGLSDMDLERWERAGISAMSDEQGLALLDAARGAAQPLFVPVRLDNAALRAQAKAGTLPAIFRGLFPVREAASASSEGSVAAQLEESPEAVSPEKLLELVQTHVAGALGHASGDTVDPQRAFKELGFDSLSAVELRNRLSEATGLKLPPTLVFDHPTPAAVVELLHSMVGGSERSAKESRGARTDNDEPIAIVGMSARFPGDVRSPEDLWELVVGGTDAIGEFPTDRGWDLDHLFDPDPDHPGTSYTRHGGFVYDAGDFDAEFFSISPREALAMDPQQRLLLEGAWEAFEDAGIDPASLKGSQTGVFTGVMYYDYGSGGLPPELEGFIGTGGSVLSGRLAYTFGLEGPAVSVDTACSSSLVAMHVACQALRQGECDLALAGGVSVLSTPTSFVQFSRQRALSPDGRCKSFGAAADGVAWAEGAGLLVLERLSDAREAGHEVLALVRGTAVNQDGASNGLTAPNGPSQERVIHQALEGAGLAPADVDAVEAHGTGTSLGDPIEAQALLATYGQERANGPLYIGSIKSNIGHTQAAAGVAGVIKMVEALRHGLLPRSLHCEEPSPHVDWSAGEVEPLASSVDWSPGERVRRAGVSSFGVSGTNAHVIIEEAPRDEAAVERTADAPPALPLLISARGDAALRAQAERLRAWLADRPELEPLDVGFTLATARGQLDRRAVVVGSDRDELLSGLEAIARDEPGDGVVDGQASGGKVVFVFPGQGSQWQGMALELMEAAPVFAESLRACAEALSHYVDWSLEDVLRGTEGAPSLDRVDVVQPALFAVMVSLAALWRSFGVEPAAVVGHSQGEIAAAHVAGGLSLDDAARVVALRSQAVLEELAGHGGMGSIALSPEDAEEKIERWGDRLSLAAVNGPASVVVSGEVDALDELLAECESDGIWARKIPVDYPSHSVRVERLEERLARDLESIEPQSGSVPFFSTVTAEVVDTAELDAGYWYRNLRNRVRFYDVVQALIEDGAGAFIEVSANPGLTVGIASAAESAGADGVAAVGSLRRDEGSLKRFLGSLGEAHVHGVQVNWEALFDGTGARRVDLPTYAFQHRRYWVEAGRGVGDLAAAGLGVVDHPLLSATLPLPGDRGASFTGQLSLARHSWLRDHAVFDRVVLPGTAYAELLLSAGAELGCGTVEELTLEAPLVLGDDDEVALQVIVGEDDGNGRREVEVYSRRAADAGGDGEGIDWVRHASGAVTRAAQEPGDELRELGEAAWPPDDAEEVDVAELYDTLADAGFGYGPAFQGLARAWRSGETTFCELALGEEHEQDASAFGVHPALLDASFHAMIGGLGDALGGGSVPLPFALSGVRVHRQGAATLRARVKMESDGSAATLAAVDEDGQPVLELESLAMRPIDAARLGASSRAGNDSLFRHEWVELAPDADEGPLRVAVLGEGLDLDGDVQRPADLDALVAAVGDGGDVPDVVFASVPDGASSDSDGDAAAGAHEAAAALLSSLQAWIAADAVGDARLALVTRGAMSVVDGEAPDPGRALLWGLVRSAQNEHPDRFVLIDLADDDDAGAVDWPALLGADEPQLAVRRGAAYAFRMTRLHTADALEPPAGDDPWQLDAPERGTLENLALVASPRAGEPLGKDEVRIAMRAGGLNFRDVLIALGQYPDDDPIGSEGAGLVVEVGEAVDDLEPGDRVMGLIPHALGPLAVSERRLLARVPEDWSHAEAASVPIVFMTAYYGLLDLGELRDGQRLLVHAGAGGVGMAAIQIARDLGAEVYATASPHKWDVLRGLGLDDDHIASSRDLDFRDRFLEATDGEGMDVVLNALAREYVDASLDLLPRGGRFVEMGKTDVRDPDEVRKDHEGVEYIPYDLFRKAGPDRVGELLGEVLELFGKGALRHLPIRAWDVRHAREAFRFLGDGRNVGKVVLTIPRLADPDGTVLVTGGTGDLGARVARHLAGEHGVRHLLLVSRRGEDSPGAGELAEELRELGAEPSIAACDVTDRDELSKLLDGIDADHPLTAVIHTAGVLDDGTIESLEREQLDRVLTPKVDAGLLLHELTAGRDLAEFVLFSSDSGTVGVPGQANYAAANVFLDALAERRRAQGLPARSLAWGLWSDSTGMAGNLGEADLARLTRLGVAAMTNELELLDAARESAEAVVVPTKLDMSALRSAAESGTLPPLMREVVRGRARRERETGGRSLEQQLADVPEEERESAVVSVVCEHAAAVLGHGSADAVDPERKFKELGFDSLGAVELRNRLAQASGMRLPSTLIFDRPSPLAVARFLVEKVAPAPTDESDGDADGQRDGEPDGQHDGESGGQASEEEIRNVLASISVEKLRSAGLLEPLVRLADSNGDDGANGNGGEPAEEDGASEFDDLDVDELVRMTNDDG